MDALSHSDKKQSIVISLLFFALWIIGLWVLHRKGSPISSDAIMMIWYLLLAFILLELHLMQASGHTGGWFSSLSLLWGIRTGMTGRRLLTMQFPLLDRISGVPIEYLSTVLTLILLLPLFLTLKKQHPNEYKKLIFPGLGLAVSACIWEPARFTLSLCFLAASLCFISRNILQSQEGKLCALSEMEMLSELNRLKNQSYADLSHEMKTPLTVISINAQLAVTTLEAGVLDEETITDIKIISTEASRLTQMVTSLAGLGKLQGTGNECALLSPDALIKATARTFQPLSERHGNTLTVVSDPDLPSVFGNADRLSQVVINLISNSNRHTKNGSITIYIRAITDWIEVSVTDNGEGIDPKLLPHVFERFCRGDKGDTGLGLPICKKIIEDHGGEIKIESEVGKGTRVWFTLPVNGGGKKETGKG